MEALDITTEFASALDLQDECRRDVCVADNSSATQARVFGQLAKKHDSFTASDLPAKKESDYWKSESRTWDLVERLYGLRAQVMAEQRTEDTKMSDDSDEFSDEHQVPEKRASVTATDFSSVQDLMAKNSLLAEFVQVRQWLEENAPEFQPVETRKGYLFYTRRSIRERDSRQAGGDMDENTGDSARTVTEADPDATSRQRKELAHEDAEYEDGLLRTLYEYVRRGRIGNAMDLCVESDEPWRAASLKGGLFWRDPKLEREDVMPVDKSDDVDVRPPGPAGNINRALWKQACAALAQDDNNNLYERALYAALSGRLDEVLLVSESWEDYVWAYVNTMIEEQIDQGIRDASVLYAPAQNTSLSHIQSKYPPVGSVDGVFDALLGHESGLLRQEAARPFHALQTALIKNAFGAYVQDFATRLELQSLGQDESDLLRIVVHCALLLRRLGFALPEDSVNLLLTEYIDQLSNDHRELVAQYVAHLPKDIQVEAYAQFLVNVADLYPVRMRLLTLARGRQLDADQISKRTAELVLLKGSAETSLADGTEFVLAEPGEPVSADEQELIRAVEWITSSPQLYEHVLVEACKLVRRFLLVGRTNAATQLLNSLPDDFVQQEWIKDAGSNVSSSPRSKGMYGGGSYKTGSVNEDRGVVATYVHEYIHLLSLCDAYAHYTTWAEVLYKRPVDKAGASCASTQWLEWKSTVTPLTEQAVYMLQSKILEVDWLGTQALSLGGLQDSGSADAVTRVDELSRLRQIYVPETVFRLHSVLYDTRDVAAQNLKRSLDLAQLVANERLGIYRLLAKPSALYPQGGLTAFMGLMRKSAFEILRGQQESQSDKPPLDEELATAISGGLV
ncbi:Nucleoporin nup84 [Coemansia sp. Benny D115]|nr:Nucleoporin nup84 [Coemansia sp. Benny D115]